MLAMIPKLAEGLIMSAAHESMRILARAIARASYVRDNRAVCAQYTLVYFRAVERRSRLKQARDRRVRLYLGG